MTTPSILPDPRDLRASVEAKASRCRDRSGPLTLVGYDANGIQQYVTRAQALPYLRGASEQVKRFDRDQRGDDCLFAAGGRGRFLMRGSPGDAVVERRITALRDSFREMTGGEVLAVERVAFDRRDEAKSLALLAARLDVAKDTAPPPRHTALGPADFEHCTVCYRRPIAEGCHWTYGKNERQPICSTCARIIDRGKKVAGHHEERGKTLEDLSDLNRIAVVSADGNQMGALFSSLGRLEDAVTASRAVSCIFEGALHSALDGCHIDPTLRVTPVVGGDDIRLFVGPERVFDIIDRLVAHLEATVDRCAPDLFPDNTEAAHRFACIGLGIGLLIGPVTHPASLGIAQAHALEDNAKRHGRLLGHRSTLDFIHLRSGDELISGVRGGCHPLGVGPNGGDELARARAAAEALTQVPSSQRSAVLRILDRDWSTAAEAAERADQGRPPHRIIDPEVANLLRYQVARSAAWQAWYAAIDVDWTDPDAVAQHAPSHAVLELARLTDLTRRGADR